jgi:hypothetical protein
MVAHLSRRQWRQNLVILSPKLTKRAESCTDQRHNRVVQHRLRPFNLTACELARDNAN